MSSGAIFAACTAWVHETSVQPIGDASRDTAARRAAIAMTAGFGLGPLAAGLLAQWAPAPTRLPYAPHIALMLVVLVALRRVPETVPGDRGRRLRLSVPGVQEARFLRVVAPMAPWVFAAPAISFALMPSVVGAGHVRDAIAVAAVVTTVTALSAVLVQPLARRLELRAAGNAAGVTGLVVLCGGLLLAAFTAHEQQVWLLVPGAVVFGSAMGLCLVAGLIEVQRLAAAGTAGRTDRGLLRTHLCRLRGAVPARAGGACRRLSAAALAHGGAGALDCRARRPHLSPDGARLRDRYRTWRTAARMCLTVS